jgi:hypothetical protein
MISDILSKALREIAEYQASQEIVHEEAGGVVEKVKLVMTAVRDSLVLLPGKDNEAKQQRLIGALSTLDTAELRNAIDS